MKDLEAINKAMEALYESIELQPHKQSFCEATQDLVFFGGK